MKKLFLIALCVIITANLNADTINLLSQNSAKKPTRQQTTQSKSIKKPIQPKAKNPKKTVKPKRRPKAKKPIIQQSNINRQQSIGQAPKLYSYSALVIDVGTGKSLLSKNHDERLPIASITKLMTAMVVLDSGADLDEYITVTDADIDTIKNTYSRLRVGTQLRRADLLLLALMSSENRAAHALGRTAYLGGTKQFIQQMNAKAKSLGMNNTIFYDSSGLNPRNQSTAQDVAKMVKAAFNYPQILADSTTKSAEVTLGSGAVNSYRNSNSLVVKDSFPIEISKTGFINEAGPCLVLYAIINQRPVVMVFLNSGGKSGRILDAIAVKNYVRQLKDV